MLKKMNHADFKPNQNSQCNIMYVRRKILYDIEGRNLTNIEKTIEQKNV